MDLGHLSSMEPTGLSAKASAWEVIVLSHAEHGKWGMDEGGEARPVD